MYSSSKKDDESAVRQGNLGRTMSMPLPIGNRGGDGDRDACRRPCHLLSRALLLSLESFLKFTLMLSCSLMFPSSLSSSIHPSSGLIYFVLPPLLLVYLHLCHLSLCLCWFFLSIGTCKALWHESPLQGCSLWSSSPWVQILHQTSSLTHQPHSDLSWLVLMVPELLTNWLQIPDNPSKMDAAFIKPQSALSLCFTLTLLEGEKSL